MIYAFGSNGSGQLGIGHRDDTSVPERVQFEQDEPSVIKRIAAGGNHTVVLSDQGDVYACGFNEDGRCALQNADILTKMHKIEAKLGGVSDIFATWSATFLLANDRTTIYACGTGEHGELGLGPGVTVASKLQTVAAFAPAPIVHVAASVSHTVVVLDNGQVWGWGKGRKGQLGAPAEDQWAPRRILGVSFDAITAAVGSDFTCVLGRNGFDQILLLGSDKRDRFRLIADVPRSLSGWDTVSASWGTVYVLTLDHTITAWGRNDRGQIPPQGLPLLTRLAAGSEHWLALTASGKAITGGWGEHGNCGADTNAKGVVQDRYNTILCNSTVVGVFAGCATSFVVTR